MKFIQAPASSEEVNAVQREKGGLSEEVNKGPKGKNMYGTERYRLMHPILFYYRKHAFYLYR